MSDLISRQVLIEQLDIEISKRYKNGGENAVIRAEGISLARLITASQPTAYDVDKVVEKLDKASDYYECDNAPNGTDSQMVFLEEAIEIVRGGGIDE